MQPNMRISFCTSSSNEALLRLHLKHCAPILSLLSRLAYITLTANGEVTSSGVKNKRLRVWRRRLDNVPCVWKSPTSPKACELRCASNWVWFMLLCFEFFSLETAVLFSFFVLFWCLYVPAHAKNCIFQTNQSDFYLNFDVLRFFH